MPEEEKRKSIAEFNFNKGILVATFSGIMSACFAFALTAGQPHRRSLARRAGTTDDLDRACPNWSWCCSGGFTTNFIWCVILNVRNRTGYQYFASHRPAGTCAPERRRAGSAGGCGGRRSPTCRLPVCTTTFLGPGRDDLVLPVLLLHDGRNADGQVRLRRWTLHMASIIIFSTMWGWILHEWKGSSKKAHLLIAGGIATLILSTIVVGYGTWLNTRSGG